MIEVPHDDPIELALTILATFDSGPSHVGLCISVEPLFAEHREEGGEKCGGETRVEYSLNLDYCVRGTCPLWKGGSIVSEGGVVNLVDENTEESGGLITRVGLELRLDVDDESGSDGGEQTSL